MTYFISDTHFGHRRIIDLCYRPFSTVENMDEHMIQEWNKVVTKDDTVVHLGDFAFYGKETVGKIVSRLNGKIELVLGNHDRGHSLTWWRECGFHRVYDKPVVYDDYFICSHEPLAWPPAYPFFSLHGHVHDREDMAPFTLKTFNVGVDVNDFKPVSYADIEAKCATLVR